MASPVWTLTCVDTGISKEISQWGIPGIQRSLASMKPGELQIVFANSQFTNASPLLINQQVILYRDAVPWFQGRVYQPSRQASGNSENHTILLRDVWQQLEAITYQQKAAFVTGVAAVPNTGLYETLTPDQITANATARQTLSGYGTVNAFSTIIYTGTDDTTQAGVPSGTTVKQALNYALTLIPGAFTLGTSFVGIQTPREQMQDVSVAEVIRRTLRWTPDVVQWIDYSTTPPTINFGERSTMATRTFTLGVDLLEQGQITPRYDIFRNGVQVNLIRQFTSGTLTYSTLTKDTAGVTTDPTTTMVVTINLDPVTTDPSTGDVSAFDPTPTGVAARLFRAIGTMFYQGTIGAVYQDLPGDNWISQTINIAGADIEFANMSALVQRSTETIEDGTINITLGPPPMLTASDIQALQRIGRARVPATVNDVSGSNAGGSNSGGNTQISPPTSAGTIAGTLGTSDPVTHIDLSTIPSVGSLQLSTGIVPFNHFVSGFDIAGPAKWVALPTPALVGGASQIFTEVKTTWDGFSGQNAFVQIVSGSLDLSSYLPGTYKAASLQVQVLGSLSAQVPLNTTYFIDVTSSLGKVARLSIPISQVPLPTVVGSPGFYQNTTGNNLNVDNVATLGNLHLQLR